MALGYAAQIIDLIAAKRTSKLEIWAFTDKERKKRAKGKGFIAQFNPASLNVEYSNDLSKPVGLNSLGPKLIFNNNNAEKISFKLVLSDSSIVHYSSDRVFNMANNYFEDKNTLFGNNYKESTFSIGSDEVGNHNIPDLNGTKDKGSVVAGLERFLNLTTQKVMDGNPVYLGIIWGDVFVRPNTDNINSPNSVLKRRNIYPCFLENVSVNYTLFSRGGIPLRAELDCTFIEDNSGD